MSDLATVTIERRDGATVARVAGELDMSNADAIREHLLEARTDGPLVLDLTAVDYLDSAWSAAMDRLARAVPGERGGLRLVCPPGAPSRRALEVAGIDQLLPLHESAEAAMASGLRPPA
jgi:anti-sigma B factor antagonist